MIETKLECNWTVIDPRIEYPKWTRNNKKKRMPFSEYFIYCHRCLASKMLSIKSEELDKWK